jgi:prepilin-type processing-associated H-X9-DG protein
VLDRCNYEEATEPVAGLLTLLASLLSVDTGAIPSDAKASPQLIGVFTALFSDASVSAAPANYSVGFEAMDKDIAVGVGQGNGGGGSTTVYRFREGIERFLITDINNPAASAMAQSELAVMWDMLATKAGHFNHVPGGSNVLYMDGHVEFLRYSREQKAPVNEQVALAGGLISGS